MVNGPSYDSSRSRREQRDWDEHVTFMDGLVDEGFVILGGSIGEGEWILLIVEDDQPIAYAGLDLGDDGIEIGAVYVRADHRGRGYGTAITRAAIAAAGDVEHLWICADADDRPKELYARLGFRPVLMTVDVLRLPDR